MKSRAKSISSLRLSIFLTVLNNCIQWTGGHVLTTLLAANLFFMMMMMMMMMMMKSK
jgi:hypothetical protein